MARAAQRTAKRNSKSAAKTSSDQVEVAVKTRKRNRPEYGSDAVAELLSRYGFEYAFLNPGSSYRGLQDSLVNYNANRTPKVVLGLHEDVVVSLAQGYATASGKPALCILHNLVGLLHGAMGVFNLYCSGQPTLILGGSGPGDIDLRGPVDYLHSANTQGEVVRPIVKWDDEATTVDGVLDSIVRGYKIANTGPKGPVYIAFDSGLQEQALDKPIAVHDVDQACFQAPPPPAAREDVVEQAVDMLMKARYPLIIGGRLGYTPEATKPIKELVELLGAAYRDDRTFVCMATAHKQNLTGSREVLEKADVILAIDCADVRSAVGGYGKDWQAYKSASADRPKVIDLSLNEVQDRTWNRVGGAIPDTALQVLADPMTGLAQINAAVRKRRRSTKGFADRAARRVRSIARDKAALVKAQEARLKARWDENPISPQRMVAELWQTVRRKPWYLTLRNHRSWPEGVWKFDGAGQYMGHSSGGGLGHGPGASVGAGFACMADGRFPVGIIGDGDFLMGMSAVWTAVHYKVPLLLVINNNTSWYNDEEHQFNVAKHRGRPPENAYIGTTTRDPEVDLAKVSEAHGAAVWGPITEPGDLGRAFRGAVKVVEDGGVAVVDVRTANL
ncbi:MAG TPA: thiamine pyrophosphate-binding protein [Alphaproteobacteria bacterium]|nr:thiamine pyrophosphate-binding protein [Alphaproteobacteria bacterium]